MSNPAVSVVDICNFALGHLGISKQIANIDSERSVEALACRRFYEIARNDMMREFPWPFTTKFAAPTLVGTDPTTEWKYSYRAPSDMLCMRRILSGNRNDGLDSRRPYRIGRDDTGGLIYADDVTPTIEYTVLITDPLMFAPDFSLALSYKLAYLVAPQLMAGDPLKLGDKALRMAILYGSKAQAQSINEEQPDQPPESSFISAR